jgi:hypothetical protein
MPDPRQLLKESWERLTSEQREEIDALVMQAWTETLAATKGRREKATFRCQSCDHLNLVEYRVEVPDILTRAKAFEVFANQAFGKPVEERRIQVDVGAQTLEALERLSTLELARMAGVEIVDGEVVGLADEQPALPPAA